jgi:hypothetical protein
MPSRAIAGECRENAQIVGRIEHVELPKSRALDGAELPARLAMKDPLGLVGPEELDHLFSL